MNVGTDRTVAINSAAHFVIRAAGAVLPRILTGVFMVSLTIN
ncbi:hypothetical protein [Tritonibacter sp. SIMBA_163]